LIGCHFFSLNIFDSERCKKSKNVLLTII